MTATAMIQTPTAADRLRIAVEKGPTFNPGNKKGCFADYGGNRATAAAASREAIAASLRHYVTSSFVVGAPRIGFLLAGEDRAEMLDASHELAWHLPLDHCSCQPKRKKRRA